MELKGKYSVIPDINSVWIIFVQIKRNVKSKYEAIVHCIKSILLTVVTYAGSAQKLLKAYLIGGFL